MTGARAQAKNAEPIIELQERTDLYIAHVKSPSSEYVLRDVEASLDGGSSILIKGTLVNTSRAGLHQYITRSRAGVYAEPNERALQVASPHAAVGSLLTTTSRGCWTMAPLLSRAGVPRHVRWPLPSGSPCPSMPSRAAPASKRMRTARCS